MNKIAFEIYKIAAEIKYSSIDKDAGFFDKLKKTIATAILGLGSMFVFDESAEAAQIKNPKLYGQQIEQTLQEETGRDVKIQVQDTKQGDYQFVRLIFTIDGERTGSINFMGSLAKENNMELRGNVNASDQDKALMKLVYESMNEAFVKYAP